MSNYLSNLQDFARPMDSTSRASYTDRTIFYTPYNQSVISKSNVSQEKSRHPSQGPSKSKLTADTLREITKTENLSQILELNLDGNSRHMKNRLKVISGLHNLMNLRELNLSNNDIEKIENLNHLKNLHILNLSFNKISKIENISVLKQLEILNLSNNLIEEIPPIIVKNANIFELNLANNMISEKNSILNLKSLPKLALLDLSNNPITEIPSYPTFVYHILKKLCTLDNKMTPNYAKAQNPGTLNTKRQLSQPPKEETPQSPAFSYDYSANEQHEVEEENTPQSYEQRLKVTQNRLNELNMLNKKVQLLSTEDIANRRLRNPFRKIEIDSKVHNPQRQMNEKQERRGEQERAIFNQNFSTNSLVSVQDKIQQQYASIPSFVVNEHTLYSVSESGHDMRFKSNMMPDSKENTLTYRNSNKDSNETQSTVSPQKRYYEFPSSQVNEFKSSSIDHLQPPNNNIHLNNFELLASSAQTPQEKGAPNWNQRILLRKVVEKESDDAQQIQGRILDNMLTNRHLPPRQLEQVNADVKKSLVENALTPRNQQEIGEAIKEFQLKIEGKFLEYDRQVYTLNEKKQNIVEVIKDLDETLQNALLAIKFRDESQISLLNEKSEFLSRLGDFLELIDYQSEHHMNFLFMLNHILAKLDENEKDTKTEQNNEVLTIEAIDERCNVSLKQIEQISKKSETLMIQILRIKEKIRALSYNSPKLNLKSNYRDDVNEQFENLYSSFDDLIQDDGIRARIFVELKNLYTDMWEIIKSSIQMRKQQKTLNVDSNPVENNSLNEFLFLSPKGNFTHSLAISSIEKDTTNNFASFKSSGNLLGQNTANIPKQTENIQSSTNKNETRLSFHQALKSMKEKIESNREYQTENLESAEKFVFQSPSDNNESTYLKETLYPYTSKLTENRSKERKELVNIIPLIKACELCQTKEDEMKIIQEKLSKSEDEKAKLEEEVMKLKAELLNVKQTTNAQIKQVQSEFLQNSAIKESEKEIYSTALINLSEACSNNSAKLDDINLMIMSQSEQFKADPLNPLQWLLTLQTSTIEDLIKLNSDTQNQLKSIATDFQNVLAIKEEQKELPSIQKFEEISALTTQNQTLEILDSKKEIETQKEFESIQLEDSKQPGLYSTNETNDPKNYQASLLLRKKLDSSKMADQKVEFHSNNSAESNEWKEGKKNALQKASSDPDLHRAFVGSVEKNRQKPVPVLTERNNPASIYNQYQFTLNMNSENTFADGNYHTADQYSSSKEKSKQNLYSNYLNQVLFGNNYNNELNQTDAQQSEDLRETPLMTESDINEYKSACQENSYRLCNFFQHPQFVRINGNALSNLQENIAQQLKQNEKRNAFQHLAKVQNNIHQYKSIRERVTEGAKRTSLKGNSLTASKRRGDSATPSNKYPSPSTSSQRRATLFEKNLNVPENSKGYSSVRSTVSQSRAQLNYENVYRKPSNYPTQRERGVKVNLKHFMSENRRALETPDIHNYHEKFDFESPYHPANLSMRCHGSQPVRPGNGVFGMHVNVPGACNVGKNIDPNLHLRFSN